MSEIKIFDYNSNQIRTVENNGEPWFVLKDVCETFGETNYRRVAIRLDEDEKGVSQIATLGGAQNMTIVNESGLYATLFAMQPEKARGVSDERIEERCIQLKQFKRWITHEVLPSIRKHGMYAMDALLDNPDLLIEVATALKAERQKTTALTEEVAKRGQIIAELNPKATYYDLILQCTGTISPSKIAKDYGKSAKWLNQKLHELGVQFKQGSVWLLYQKHASCGYTQSRTFPIVHADGTPDTQMSTYWTQKGRLFIYDLLKNNGVVPIIEREAA